MKTHRSLAAILAVASSFFLPALAQTVLPRITVGTTPVGIAVNPVTNKAYVANAGSNNVSIIDGATHTVVGTLGTSAGPRWVGINVEANRVFVTTLAGANTTIINGSTDTIVTTLSTGGGGWIAINPMRDSTYVPRYGGADELNWITGVGYNGTAAVHGNGPVGLAVNPNTNRVYIANAITGDVAALDGTIYSSDPTLFCPAPGGGFKPQPAPSDPATPCIDVPGTPVGVAVNPTTNRIYALSGDSISVILGSDHTFTTLVPPGGLTGGKAIAVNPFSNKAYALFANGVVVVNGADNAVTAVPIASGTPVAIGINVLTNKVYVPLNNGSLAIIDGATNAGSVLTGIPTNANAIAVNPLSNVVYITDAAGGVTPVAGPVGEPTVHTGIVTAINPTPGGSAPASGTFTINATGTDPPAPATPVRRVYYRIDSGPWTQASGPPGTGPFNAPYAGLAPGSHTIQAFSTVGLEGPTINTDLASVPVLGHVSSYTFNVPSPTSGPQMGLSRTSVNFGGQSMATTSAPETVTITNSGSGSLSLAGLAVTSQFTLSHNCTPLAAGASCAVQLRFNPAINGSAALNSSTPVNGTLTLHSNAFGSPHTVALAGSAEKSSVTHYYRSILGRAPDDGGRTFWHAEAQRVVSLGANVNEAWYAMAMAFFASGEYAGVARTDGAYVTELYRTFFNRDPDSAGMSFWTGQLAAGLPREAALASFMFSAEFRGFSQAIFGNPAVRAEIDVVTDFFRGLLARLPDNGGFAHWLQRFRAAQCQGGNAVYAEVETMSSLFALSPEYAARSRTNAQYVGDLYNGFLRRGGDVGGVQHWISQLNSGAMTREQVRREFVAAPEFNARVVAIVNQGCFS